MNFVEEHLCAIFHCTLREMVTVEALKYSKKKDIFRVWMQKKKKRQNKMPPHEGNWYANNFATK